MDAFEFLKAVRDLGVKGVIYTDISRDGAMQGTNIEAYKRLKTIEGLDVVASGGICRYDEIITLNKMGVYGAILGKALYTGAINLKQALSALSEGVC